MASGLIAQGGWSVRGGASAVVMMASGNRTTRRRTLVERLQSSPARSWDTSRDAVISRFRRATGRYPQFVFGYRGGYAAC